MCEEPCRLQLPQHRHRVSPDCCVCQLAGTGRGGGGMIKPRMMACLKQLHLPAFVEHYAPQAALAGNEGWPYDRYLLGLCELELAERDSRRIQRLLTDSKLPRE